MIFKTIIFAFIFYMLVKVIGSLFLPKPNSKQSNFRFFYQAFKNVRNQQKQQEQQSSQNGKAKNKLDDIEEAEYEDVTENQSESSK